MTQHYNTFLSIAKSKIPEFVLDDYTHQVLHDMLKYFSGSKQFKGSLNKGILLFGKIGTGKTTLFRLFEYYTLRYQPDRKFILFNSRQIARSFAKTGYPGLEEYSYNPKLNQYNVVIQNPFNLCIDDLGLELQISNYGNMIEPIEELVNDRYELFKERNITTHFTTNLDPRSLKERYSNRVTSRLREMCNVLFLKGEDRRK